MKKIYMSLAVLFGLFTTCQQQAERPNILWITIEDLTPMLGCYGDRVARSPNIDKLAESGVKYTNAYATAAVCSPARSCLLTGVFATSLGTQHLRSTTNVPDSIVPFPKYLRKAGYYCTNNYKEDYNFSPDDVWDESSKSAHWRNRMSGQPFFAVFNLETTHQSQIFGSDSTYEQRFHKYLPLIQRTNPGSIDLPTYFFDTPEIRRLWARYYDNVQIVDLQVQEIIDQLRQDGLMGNTIIFFYSDHGTGMPRGKRALYDSGLKVPMIIVAPEKYQKVLGLLAGTSEDRLVSFVDFAPTILNILNIPLPGFMQGKPFLGKNANMKNKYVFATSDRVDEAYEAVRSVRSGQYRYVKNLLPHMPLIQPNYYSDQSEIMKEVYRVLESAPKLTAAQKSMWLKKRPFEELYDTKNDPFETNNLANDPAYLLVIQELRAANNSLMKSTHDSGLAPESYMYEISEGATPYEKLQDPEAYPMDMIINMQHKLYKEGTDDNEVLNYLNDPHPLINYWTIIWLQYQEYLAPEVVEKLQQMIEQPESFVSIAAAETLCKFDHGEKALDLLVSTLRSENPHNLLMAARAIELLGSKTDPAKDAIMKEYQRLREQTKDNWKGYDLYASWALSELFNP
jgi:N-sulfoglucosamine sulfohydrolase